ncbi:unnamed protein product [Rhizophagus irregularis]|nr:unnamed protein product [Rhizophagus irregularis]
MSNCIHRDSIPELPVNAEKSRTNKATFTPTRFAIVMEDQFGLSYRFPCNYLIHNLNLYKMLVPFPFPFVLLTVGDIYSSNELPMLSVPAEKKRKVLSTVAIDRSRDQNST